MTITLPACPPGWAITLTSPWIDMSVWQQQRHYNHCQNALLDTILRNMETRPMKLSDYTTEELTRLTTLTGHTTRAGEYSSAATERPLPPYKVWLKTDRGTQVNSVGHEVGIFGRHTRRVTSFTDPTELDPPQAEMLAELERRRRPAISNDTHAGRRVRRYDGLVAVVVHPAVVRAFTAEWGAQPGKVHLVSLDDGNAYTAAPCDLELLD